MNEIKIALLGLGTVGCGVARILQSHGAELAERAGCALALGRVADADLTRSREGIDLSRWPHVKGWLDRRLERPAAKRARKLREA